MARPVTLFTGQWADLSLDQLAAKCGEWEFDGLELATWGDHFDIAVVARRVPDQRRDQQLPLRHQPAHALLPRAPGVRL